MLAHAEHEERVRQMTQDQTRILGFLSNQRRVAVVGGAGSGKTWLALEQTCRLARDGQSVARVCYGVLQGKQRRRPIELAPFTLERNLRNTKRIAQVFGSLCLRRGCDRIEFSGGDPERHRGEVGLVNLAVGFGDDGHGS